MCAASKMPTNVSSTSRARVSLKWFWNLQQEREIPYTNKQNQFSTIKIRKEKNGDFQCEHHNTLIKNKKLNFT